MIVLALIVKPVAWFFAFKSGTRGNLDGMLLYAAVITLFLTLMDKISVASNLAAPAIVLTLVLYLLMSFTLIPVAWKIHNKTCSMVLGLVGILGAFAGVNFTMDFIRGIMPFMNR